MVKATKRTPRRAQTAVEPGPVSDDEVASRKEGVITRLRERNKHLEETNKRLAADLTRLSTVERDLLLTRHENERLKEMDGVKEQQLAVLRNELKGQANG